VPFLDGANTWSGVQSFDSGKVALKGASSGTITLNAAATAGTNILTLPAGTTDFSATGGAGQVVKQSSAGAALTVGTQACADLSDDGEGCSNAARAANTVLAGPATGAAAAPTFRLLSTADVTGTLACADLTNDGTACTANTGTSGTTLPFLDGTNTWSGAQTFGPVYGSIGNSGAVISGTTYTFAAADCGKTVVFTSGSAVTATIPASIVPATTMCAMAVLQAGAGKVSVNGSAVTPATLISDSSFTGTSGTAGSMIGLTLLTISAATNAYLTGAGS
jgi:hypothetical protein